MNLVLAETGPDVTKRIASDGEAGDALVVGALGGEDAGGRGGGSAPFSSHAETAANISVPVAHEISPSRIFMALSCFLSPFGSRRRRNPRRCVHRLKPHRKPDFRFRAPVSSPSPITW